MQLSRWRPVAAVALIVMTCGRALSQDSAVASKPAPPPPPPATAIAATVNGRSIPELAVHRALLAVPAEQRAKARHEVVLFLVENMLIDQYLEQLRIVVEPQAIEARFKEIETEANKKDPKGFEKMLQAMFLTEPDLRKQIANELRFEKFVDQQATEKALRGLFDSNHALFDGSMMRARHILLTPAAGDPQAAAEARDRLLAMKKQVEEQAAAAANKLGADADKLAREKARVKALEEAFADLATRESACPSRKAGGNLPWFPRIAQGPGTMVEPFARAAFALKPYQISDVVTTQFGLHLILAIDYRPGKDVKFEDVRDVVKDVYADRLHQAIVARMRPRAQIALNPPSAAKE
jgi:parvulin-like peptidyl-prolyl isomerase